MNTNRLAPILIALALVAGCKREEGIRAYNAPKDPPPGQPVATAESIHWSTPPAWKQISPGPMVHSAYQVSDNPPVKMTVSQITSTGSPDTTVLANVNRWKGQLGLPPVGQAELSQVVTPLQVAARDVHSVDLLGPEASADGKPQQRMLAALVADGEKFWAFKLVGPSAIVAAQKSAFDETVKSIHFDGGSDAHAPTRTPAEQPAPPQSAESAAPPPGIVSYNLPAGWQTDPTPRQFRAGTIIVGSGDEKADIAISKLGASSLDDIPANINRWRGQVHLPPTSDPSAHAPQTVTLAQGPAVIYDFAGPESDGPARKRLLVAVTKFPKAEQLWFFRFLGPHDVVAKSKPAFETFVKSVKFAE